MSDHKIDLFIATNSKYLKQSDLLLLRDQITNMSDDKWAVFQTIQFKDPTIAIILSLLAGGLGIDRFYIGDIGLGILKLITFGGLGIWTIVDWFIIMDATKGKNKEIIGAQLEIMSQ